MFVGLRKEKSVKAKPGNEMRILVICPHYSPALNPRSLRWTSIAEYLVSRGHAVTVVANWISGCPKTECLNGVRVVRTGLRSIEQARGMLRDSRRASRGLMRVMIRRLHDCTWKRVYWPDSSCLWYFPALREAAQYIRGSEAFVTVSHPFTAHLVGLTLKKAFPSKTWIADTGDPFSFLDQAPPNNHLLYGRLNVKAETWVLRGADWVAVTVGAAKAEYVKRFPWSDGKIQVIPPLLPAGCESMSCGESRHVGRRALVYIGTLYRGIRSPVGVLRLFDLIRRTRLKGRVELHFYGDTNQCMDVFEPYGDLLGKEIYVHGVVSRDVVSQAIANASILINIGNRTSFQLPSKLVEYVASGKPIVTLVNQAEDTSIDFLSRYPGAYVWREDNASPEIEWLVQLVESPPSVAPSVIRELLREYRVESVGGAYESLLLRGRK